MAGPLADGFTRVDDDQSFQCTHRCRTRSLRALTTVEILSSPIAFAAIFALICVEALWVFVVTTRAAVPRMVQVELLVNLLAGASLLSAAALALAAASWVWIALSLLTALFAHVFDLQRRLLQACRWH